MTRRGRPWSTHGSDAGHPPGLRWAVWTRIARPVKPWPPGMTTPSIHGVTVRIRGVAMSLDVSPDLLDAAERGEVSDAAFVDCVRTSLPYAWTVISGVAADLRAADAEFADHEVPPPSEAERGQLL